ncbi:hypothetical protein [uncultured Xylophilus sp.]|uniref:hypothetical protein n=1 Tax=uncultured Xylophilus sp. TaxID=296832 RepID=UPI0025DC1761|nr:hypothetical protein [uncultured Xylophilus sp.]
MTALTDEGLVQELNHARPEDRVLFATAVPAKGPGLRLRDRQSVGPLQFEGDAIASIVRPPDAENDPPPSADGQFGPAPDDEPEYAVRCWVDGERCGAEIVHRDPVDGSQKDVATWEGEFFGGAQDVDAVRIATIAIARRQLDL